MSIELTIILGIFAHMVGDYLLQSDWMAKGKTSQWWPAIIHGITYGLPFLLLTQSPLALLVIVGTHILIDRFRLAKYLIWLKEHISPRSWWPRKVTATGYSEENPPFMAVWLMIIADNLIHIIINSLALVLL